MSAPAAVRSSSERYAPGWPGAPALWTSSAKTGVGTARARESRVWFTLSHGIVNEVYYPRIDHACVRDMQIIVTDARTYFSEEKRDTEHTQDICTDGVPSFHLTNTSRDGRYRVEKWIITDPHRNVLLTRVRFMAHEGAPEDYRVHVLLAPHVGNQGGGNTAWLDEVDGTRVLSAARGGTALALAASVPFGKRSAGFVGTSDGWQDLNAHKELTWEYTRAENGNVALVAELDLKASDGECVLALGFGADAQGAAHAALASLEAGFDAALHDYEAAWEGSFEATKLAVAPVDAGRDLGRTSLAVLRAHAAKTPPGAIIASLTIPWGASKGDEDTGGYHVVWPRDLVETAGGLLAAGANEDARDVLSFLEATQQADGHWPQNMWLDGSPYWQGVQMDETALPIVLVDLAFREGALDDAVYSTFWPMVRRAAGYLVQNGPVSQQDRWEEDPGYTPFTVAAQIAALLAAADHAARENEPGTARHLRETADIWHDAIDHSMRVSGTDWCAEFGVEGYYVRIAPAHVHARRDRAIVLVKNVPAADDRVQASHLVSPDALALARFGLRAADDPRMQDTVKVLDALLRTDMPYGPIWHRYNDDGYGEHRDGAPFDGIGVGRAWPLLTGERAHFELLRGDEGAARALAAALSASANEYGLIPEQVWDAPDIPERELFFGRPSGSAMPLVWAHAEYLKLMRSLADGRVFDLPPQPVERYLTDRTVSSRVAWRFNNKLRRMPTGKMLRIETLAPVRVHWSANGWRHTADSESTDTGLGVHVVDLPTAGLPHGSKILFTFYWPDAARWEGTDFRVKLVAKESY